MARVFNAKKTVPTYGHFYKKSKNAKVISLNTEKIQDKTGNQPKYKEGDIFVSKKIIINLDKVNELSDLIHLKKFKENERKVDLIKVYDGQIQYMFKHKDQFLSQDDVDKNYIHHYKNKVWEYYIESNKNFKPIVRKKKKKKAKSNK